MWSRGCLQFAIVVFPDHPHLLFLRKVPYEVNSESKRLLVGRPLYLPDEQALSNTFYQLKSLPLVSLLMKYIDISPYSLAF